MNHATCAKYSSLRSPVTFTSAEQWLFLRTNVISSASVMLSYCGRSAGDSAVIRSM